jgi:hypothetical protein
MRLQLAIIEGFRLESRDSKVTFKPFLQTCDTKSSWLQFRWQV